MRFIFSFLGILFFMITPLSANEEPVFSPMFLSPGVYSLESTELLKANWYLSNEDRAYIVDQIEHCVIQMFNHLDKADKHCAKITDIDKKKVLASAIAGAITGLTTKNAYAVVAASCTTALGTIANDSIEQWGKMRKHLKKARQYAWYADRLQDYLWRDGE